MDDNPRGVSPDVSIVIPVYRSRDCLAPLVEELTAVLSGPLAHGSYEVILVNDDRPNQH